MSFSSASSLAGVLTSLPAAVAGALSGAPWWAVGALIAAAYLAIPLTGLILDHIRQRKGNYLDEEFTAALREISDPEKRIQALIRYREAAASPAPQPPPEPPPTESSAGTPSSLAP